MVATASHGIDAHSIYHKLTIKYSHHLLELCCSYISVVGAIFLVLGVFMSLLNLLRAVINLAFGAKLKMIGATELDCLQKASFQRVRLQLGGFTALGLEILVVADVLETLTKSIEEQTYENLGKLCAIAAFRTALSYFLGREIKEVMEEIVVEEEIVRRASQGNLTNVDSEADTATWVENREHKKSTTSLHPKKE